MQAEDYADLYALEEDFWWFAGMREITAALLPPVSLPLSGSMVLDAGCGTGGMLSWLAARVPEGTITGIDLFEEALRFCRNRGHKHLAQASVTELPFADSTFDLVTSFDVLVQLRGTDAAAHALSEMHRVLRPGGIAFVRVAAYEWMRSSHDKALGTQHRYVLGELVQKMEQAGFRVLRATYANSILLPVAMLRRLVFKRVGLADGGSDVKPLPQSLSWLNVALKGVLITEARLLKRIRRLPIGLSAICVAQRLPHVPRLPISINGSL
jgi:ubiquinone/menaquinone biosynthesis C-methylase UbiE